MNRIRAQRAFSVQTPEQYQFCLAALREVLRRKIMEEEESEEESENESDEEMSEDEDWNSFFYLQRQRGSYGTKNVYAHHMTENHRLNACYFI